MKIAVLVSGQGSILEALIRERVPIALVAGDRECRALEAAENAGIPTELVERGDFGASFDRHEYTERLMHVLKTYGIELVAMAGFMTFLSEEFFENFGGRVLNTHPSLLPRFKGDHAVRDALESGAQETGCTIHIATEKLDEGQIIAQETVPIHEGDTVDALHERIKQAERRLYPRILKDIVSGELALPRKEDIIKSDN
ncbi:MAG: phosphoribosylglycinamide formyltransferase [Patescibacteria group bacterium]|nr:phosphoribosylglycinamide formyltransferase [Patescibacteria group bacterium]